MTYYSLVSASSTEADDPLEYALYSSSLTAGVASELL